MSGCVATVVTQPIDIVKTLLSIQVVNSNKTTQNTNPSNAASNLDFNKGVNYGVKYNGLIDCLTKIGKSEGIRGLYKGLGTSLAGIFPFIGFKMSSFDSLKSFTSQIKHDGIRKTMNIVNGALAGTIALTLSYPTDVLRRRMQVQDLKKPKQTGMINCAKTMIQEEGLKSL